MSERYHISLERGEGSPPHVFAESYATIELARRAAERLFAGRVRTGMPVRTIAIKFKGRIVYIYDGDWTDKPSPRRGEVIIKGYLWSDEALIAIANAMSTDIDKASIDTAASLDETERERIMTELTRAFDATCNILEQREVVISDHVICPKEW